VLSYSFLPYPYHSPPLPFPQLEMPLSRRHQQHHHHRHHHNGDGPSGAGNGQSSASTSSTTSSSSTTARPAHTKVLRAKDASYSEGILQDFRREEIPTELAKFYDLQGMEGGREGGRKGGNRGGKPCLKGSSINHSPSLPPSFPPCLPADIIGIGTTSKVYRCKRRARQVVHACKVIDKRKLNMEVDNKDLLLEQLRKEIEILQHLHHPNIVQFEDVIETAEKLFVIMELIQGGELFEYLLDRGPLPEDVALHIFRQVMGAITYMHDRGVVHRDLKAENLLVVDPTADYPTVKVRKEGGREGQDRWCVLLARCCYLGAHIPFLCFPFFHIHTHTNSSSTLGFPPF